MELESLLYIVLAMAVLVGALLFTGFLPGARIHYDRTVLVHAGRAQAWEAVRRFPELHSRHGRVLDYGDVPEWTLRRGDGETAGSVWLGRGMWAKTPYWIEVELVRIAPGRELSVRLRRDSLETQRGLAYHRGTLHLEEVGADATKITWSLEARLSGPRLVLARSMSAPMLRARLLDQSLRRLKTDIDYAAKIAKERGHDAGMASLVAPPPANASAGPSLQS